MSYINSYIFKTSWCCFTRQTKATFWEGGTRGAALLWSPLLQKKARVANQRLHITDWLPTLFGVAGGNVSVLKDIDGIDQWDALSKDETSRRTTIVYNIDQFDGTGAISIDDWKLVTGRDYNGEWDNWYGPDGYEGTYNKDLVQFSPAGKAISALKLMPSKDDIDKLRKTSQVICGNLSVLTCDAKTKPCLFNLAEDPCERQNLASERPETLKKLWEEFLKANATSKLPSNLPLDSLGNPKYWGRVYTNFGDYEKQH